MGEDMEVDIMGEPIEGITGIPRQVLTTSEGATFQEVMFQVLTQDAIPVIEG